MAEAIAERSAAGDPAAVAGDAASADEAAQCCVSAPPAGALEAEDSARLAARFKALADPNRLRLLSLVAAGDSGEACVCDLTGPLDLGQPTVSHHLKILVDAGLVTREKRGVWAYYSVVPGALDDLAGALHGFGATPGPTH